MTGRILLSIFLVLLFVGCSQSGSVPNNTSPTVNSDISPKKDVAVIQEKVASSEAAAIKNSKGEESTSVGKNPKKQPDPTPAELKLIEARHVRDTSLRIQQVIAEVTEEEPSTEERKLMREIEGARMVYRMLGEDIAQDASNIQAQRGLVMPWEVRGSRIRDFTSAFSGKRKLSPMLQELSTRIGNEQLASVAQTIRFNEIALANLRTQRSWAKLSATEQEEMRRYQPEYASEASGDNLRRLKEIDEALAKKRDPKLYVERAEILWRRGDLEGASENFYRALYNPPENADEIRLLSGQLEEERGMANSAGKLYLKVANAKSPLSAKANVMMGRLHLSQGRSQPALQSARAALEIDPTLVMAKYLEAEAYIQMGDSSKALEKMAEIMKQAPDNAELQFRLGKLQEETLHWKEAAEHYSRAIELDATWWQLRLDRARVRFILGDSKDAVDDYNAALEWHPNDEEIISHRAVALKELGDSPDTKADQEAVKNPK